VAISTGTGIIGGLGCPFTLNGIGTIFDNFNAITIHHRHTASGRSGYQTLRRPAPPAPAPAPSPEPPQPGENPHHVPLGRHLARAEQIILRPATQVLQPAGAVSNTGQKVANAEEMLPAASGICSMPGSIRRQRTHRGRFRSTVDDPAR
jgi:hypothetical protein